MVLIPRHNIRHENPTPLHGRRAVGRALGQTGPYTLEEKREDTQSSLSLQNSEALLELCSSRHWANIGSFFDTERRSFKRLGAPSTKLKLASVHSNIGPIWKNADPKLRVRASRSNHLGSLISEALVGDSSKPDHVTGRELDAKALGEGLPLGGVPDDQAERDLVHEVRQVVDEVKSGGSDGAAEVAEEVTQGVDGPADSDDEAHGTEGRLHGLGNTSGGDLASLTDEDLEQDVAPSAHAHNKAHPGVDPMLLTHVAEGKHDDEENEDDTREGSVDTRDESLEPEERKPNHPIFSAPGLSVFPSHHPSSSHTGHPPSSHPEHSPSSQSTHSPSSHSSHPPTSLSIHPTPHPAVPSTSHPEVTPPQWLPHSSHPSPPPTNISSAHKSSVSTTWKLQEGERRFGVNIEKRDSIALPREPVAIAPKLARGPDKNGAGMFVETRHPKSY